jgi:F0F1-type ATP synthase membrane subunit b/b'
MDFRIVSQQIFWSVFSFFLFHYLMKKLVITKIEKIKDKRISELEFLQNQVNDINNHIKDLVQESHRMKKEEFDAKKREYLKEKLDILNQEIFEKLEDEKAKVELELKGLDVSESQGNLDEKIKDLASIVLKRFQNE